LGGGFLYSIRVSDKANERLVDNSSNHLILNSIKENNKLDLEKTEKFLNTISQAIESNKYIQEMYIDAISLQDQKLKTASHVEKSIIGGVELNNYEAQELIKGTYNKAKDVRLDGEFQILKLDWDNNEYTSIKLRRVADNLEVVAMFNREDLSEEQSKVIKNAEWSKGIIFVEINAKQIGDRIDTANLISVSEVKK
jgi:hypothetical protein